MSGSRFARPSNVAGQWADAPGATLAASFCSASKVHVVASPQTFSTFSYNADRNNVYAKP